MPINRQTHRFLLCTLCIGSSTALGLNLVENPGFEEPEKSSDPAVWMPLTFGPEAEFSTDRQIKHSGSASIRIQAVEVTRTYITTPWIQVAPGERLRMGAWTRIQNVPREPGATLAIAEFDATRGERMRKIDVAAQNSDWQHLSGQITVPAYATLMRLRLGFSYSSGTCWWDDVTIEPERLIVVRARLADDRLYPSRTLQVLLINRGRTQPQLTIRALINHKPFTRVLSLDGSFLQVAEIPLEALPSGAGTLALQVLSADQKNCYYDSGPMKVVVPPPVTLFPIGPTHWVVEDGRPTMDLSMDLAVWQPSKDSLPLQLELFSHDGRLIESRTLGPVSICGPHKFPYRCADQPRGRYRLRVSVHTLDGRQHAAEQPWEVIAREDAQTTLSPDGFFRIRGKTLLPLGMFNSGRFEESAAAGFNVTHAYNASRVQRGRRPDDQRVKNFLDQTQAAGMHALLMVPLDFAYAGQWDAFRQRIRLCRNHPALLAWDEEEGLARGAMTMGTLARMRQILREEDPHHPFMVGDSRDVIRRVTDRTRFFPAQHMDLGMWWWYPFPLKDRTDDALVGEVTGSGRVLELPQFLTQSRLSEPLWVGIQAYKKSQGRYPTPAEYRAQAYAAICAGAKGLMWYGAYVTGGLFQSPTEGHWDELKKLVAEFRDLATLPADPCPARTGSNSFRRRRSSQPCVARSARTLLIAVNRGIVPMDASLALPEASPSAPWTVRGENRKLIPGPHGLSDHFEPLGVHIYERPDS